MPHHRHRTSSCTTIYQRLYYCITAGNLISQSFAIGSNRLENTLLASQENTVISPWSLISTFIPLQIGSDKETRKELTEVIGNYRSTATQIPTLGNSLTALFTTVPLLQSYKTDINRNAPNVLVKENFNFSDHNIRLINELVEEQTAGLIRDLIQPGQLGSDTRMVVINAFYFKGRWRTPFEKSRPMPFYTFSNGKEKSTEVATMYQRNSFYTANIPELEARIIEIPYALNRNSSLTTVMQVILPNEKFGLAKLVEKVATFDLESIKMKLGEVDLYLPKFKIESEVIIDSGVAKKIGLSKTFSNTADLSKLSETPLRIDKIISKTKIDVNEEGTEGASGTAVHIVPLIGLAFPSFVADHPFLFYIFEGTNMLFSGAVSNLRESSQEDNIPIEPFNLTEEVVGFKEGDTTSSPGENKWWIHTGKPEYLMPSAVPTLRFQQPEPKHPSGIRFPYPETDPTTQLVINSHLQNQSALNNTV